MHQLKGLIWKAYKVRLRSPLTTSLDVGGPIALMCIYLCVKAILGNIPADIDPGRANANIFTNPTSKPLDPAIDLRQHLCTKILLYSATSSRIGNSLKTLCGIEVVNAASRDDLMARLRSSLSARESFIEPGKDLNKHSKSRTGQDGCFTLPGAREPNYQAGIVQLDDRHYELHMTDTMSNPVISWPFSQNSPYNEFRLPQGDLNSGVHLLTKCLNEINRPGLATGNSSSSQPAAKTDSAKLRLKAYPMATSASIIPILFLVMNLAANLFSAIGIITRVADDNETGLHHYIRSAGVPAGIYWLSQLIMNTLYALIENLVIACILSIPIKSETLLDPLYEANFVLRWLLLFSYTFSIGAHALFIASLLEKTSHAVLVTCFLAVSYGMYPLTFTVRWTPYSFANYNYLFNIMLLNPCSCYEALLLVLYGIRMQTNEPTRWSHFSMKALDGGMSQWSMFELWCILMLQAAVYFLATILIDQLYYGPSIKNPLSFLSALVKELICCNSCGSPASADTNLETKSSFGAPKTLKSTVSKRDPNRICCSLRRVSVIGPQVSTAHTVGDPLKMKPDQYSELVANKIEPSHVSKTHQYLVNRSHSTNSALIRDGNRVEEPIFLDEALQQHIVWQKANIAYNNLSLDFRFNQVSFIMGRTDLKELFFATLLGLRTIQSGYVELDETKYTAATMHLARPHIGHLSDRDIFLNEMTIFENLQFFGSLRDPSYSQFDSESLFVLSLLHLTSRRDNLPYVLTNRSARKLALAVASVGHTKLLLLTEPTLHLRWKPRCHVLNLLKKYKSIRSIIVDTSDVDEATAFGDRIVLLRNGRADLDGTPSHLSRKLSCGYLLVFEYTNSPTIPTESIRALDKLTSEVFKQDKLLHLSISRRSVYDDRLISDISALVTSKKSAAGKTTGHKSHETTAVASKFDVEKLHKTTVILKVHHSTKVHESLCSILQMFALHSVHGFRLVELNYQSLEDIIVLRMSKATYPDLPPDLLLSLQHRTQTTRSSSDPPQVSVRKFPSESHELRHNTSMFAANVKAILRDRATAKKEVLFTLLASLVAVMFVCAGLYAMKVSLHVETRPNDKTGRAFGYFSEKSQEAHNSKILEHSLIDEIYLHRIGFYVMEKGGTNATSYLNQWPLNSRLTGTIPANYSRPDIDFIANFIDSNKDLPISLIVLDPETKDATISFDKNLPHAMLASMRAFTNYQAGVKPRQDRSYEIGYDGSDGNTKITQHNYEQSWHEIIHGRQSRRLFYGLGFGIAEGIAMGVAILGPMRHRSEAKEVKVRSMYWFAMFMFDISIAFIQITGYLLAMAIMEGTMSLTFALCSFLVLLLYKLAALPLLYLIALLTDSVLSGFLFVLMSQITIAWVFSIHLRTFFEITLFNGGYIYIISNWLVLLLPLSSLIDALTEISHTNRINELCSKVPAYAATRNVVNFDGTQPSLLLDKSLEKVQECLANGKTGISYDIFHRKTFGILWDIYLMMIFGAICWIFLLFSDRVFGIIVKRFTSYRTSQDPLKTIIRSPETSLYKWDKEKDRLVSEYIRCANEARYVRQMAANCMYLRIWLKPMGDQSSIDKQLPHILEPLVLLGQSRNDTQIELKTTLQVFVRLGNERNRCKIDRIQLIAAYSKYVRDQSDKVVKFAVIDWTRETLYKILLHGFYNTKATPII